jgi:hypothetical protein
MYLIRNFEFIDRDLARDKVLKRIRMGKEYFLLTISYDGFTPSFNIVKVLAMNFPPLHQVITRVKLARITKNMPYPQGETHCFDLTVYSDCIPPLSQTSRTIRLSSTIALLTDKRAVQECMKTYILESTATYDSKAYFALNPNKTDSMPTVATMLTRYREALNKLKNL